MINQKCVLYGHRLTRPKYFGKDDNYYVRHCMNCEYVAAGEIVIDPNQHRITVEKQNYKRVFEQNNDITSTQSKQVDNSTTENRVKDQ